MRIDFADKVRNVHGGEAVVCDGSREAQFIESCCDARDAVFKDVGGVEIVGEKVYSGIIEDRI